MTSFTASFPSPTNFWVSIEKNIRKGLSNRSIPLQSSSSLSHIITASSHMPAHTYQAYYGKESGEAWRTYKMTGSVLGGLQGFLFNTGLGKKLPAALNNIKREKLENP